MIALGEFRLVVHMAGGLYGVLAPSITLRS
jgi:hypothetical protein